LYRFISIFYFIYLNFEISAAAARQISVEFGAGRGHEFPELSVLPTARPPCRKGDIMASTIATTLADPTLPPEVLMEMERLNAEAAPHHIWLRTRANAPQKAPWHRQADETPVALPDGVSAVRTPPPLYKPAPCLWRWADIHPYLLRIADIAPLEFTDRQQFLLLNPGLGGALRVTNTIRVAVSIYKAGDQAVTHNHTPNASRTILSHQGGYTTVEGEHCEARRGDLILTPNGTWHGHGNDGDEPVIWMDVLDWPLLERLDCIWIEDEDAARAANAAAPSPDWSRRHYGTGGMIPTFVSHQRGIGRGNSPMLHYTGADIRRTLEGLATEEGDPYEGIRMAFTNPSTGGPVFTTLGYTAQLLRPAEETRPKRETASRLYCCLAGHGYTEIAGKRYDWSENDIFVVPNHLWRRHVNLNEEENAVLYAVSDAPLLHKIGHYRAQGRTRSGDVVELDR
jgi:gentisate 1,2-dioxygenase